MLLILLIQPALCNVSSELSETVHLTNNSLLWYEVSDLDLHQIHAYYRLQNDRCLYETISVLQTCAGLRPVATRLLAHMHLENATESNLFISLSSLDSSWFTFIWPQEICRLLPHNWLQREKLQSSMGSCTDMKAKSDNSQTSFHDSSPNQNTVR